MKRAFTLIELLVVIAIIAILAAILFPVFAQAKAAAKGTASLSNAKQMGTALFIYTGDSDDVALLDCAWDNGTGPIVSASTGRTYGPWGSLLLPYMKTSDLFMDPLTTADVATPNLTLNTSHQLATQFGYNYSTWSPVFDNSGTTWPRVPVSMTAPAEPSNTVLFASKYNRSEIGNANYSYGAGSILAANSAEPPDCSSRTSWCFAGWGVSSNYTGLLPTKESGKYTGGNSIRRSGNAVVVFGDSHASAMKPGRLAAGTNYIEGSTTQTEAQIVVNDKTKYMWDVE